MSKAIPALAYLAGEIGDPAVRHMGTLGGSVANNDPAADYPAAVLGLGATIKTTKREHRGRRFLHRHVRDRAGRRRDRSPRSPSRVPERAAYAKFPNPASRYAMAGVFVAKTKDGVRVAVTGAGPCVFRVPEMEAALAANFTPDAVAGITVPADDLNSDLHGSAEYRAHLVTVMAKRAVAAALTWPIVGGHGIAALRGEVATTFSAAAFGTAWRTAARLARRPARWRSAPW